MALVNSIVFHEITDNTRVPLSGAGNYFDIHSHNQLEMSIKSEKA